MNESTPTPPQPLESCAEVIRCKPRFSIVWLCIHLVIFTVLLLTDEWQFPILKDATQYIEKYVFSFDYCREFGHFYSTALACVLIWILLPAKRRAVPYLIVAVLVASVAMELMKVTTARKRPNHSEGKTVFLQPFTAESPSMPSGHATAAMANANALSLLFPPARPVFYFIAIGTGLSRVEQGRHFMSDVYLGFIFGIYFTNGVAFFWRRRSDMLDKVFTPGRLMISRV